MNLKRFSFVAGAVAGLGLFMVSGCETENKRYEPSAVQTLEIRTIPASRQMKTVREGDYFTQDGALFKDLFGYLRSQDLSMTVPVAVEIGKKSSMAFYVADSEKDKASAARGNVFIQDVPAMTVAVLAFTGENSPERYRDGVAKLRKLIEDGKKYQIDGDFYVTYWDSPMRPGFMRHYEITVPVKPLP